MAGLEERVVELAQEALAEQERTVSDVRGRASTLLAAGAVVATLLAGDVFRKGHPSGGLEWVCAGLGLAGAGALLIGALLLLFPQEIGYSLDAVSAYDWITTKGYTAPQADLAIAKGMQVRRTQNQIVVRRLTGFLAIAVVGLALETAGFASAAALVSRVDDNSSGKPAAKHCPVARSCPRGSSVKSG